MLPSRRRPNSLIGTGGLAFALVRFLHRSLSEDLLCVQSPAGLWSWAGRLAWPPGREAGTHDFVCRCQTVMEPPAVKWATADRVWDGLSAPRFHHYCAFAAELVARMHMGRADARAPIRALKGSERRFEVGHVLPPVGMRENSRWLKMRGLRNVRSNVVRVTRRLIAFAFPLSHTGP
jgi:hypothetical protein